LRHHIVELRRFELLTSCMPCLAEASRSVAELGHTVPQVRASPLLPGVVGVGRGCQPAGVHAGWMMLTGVSGWLPLTYSI
jgi:hypothetical protein